MAKTVYHQELKSFFGNQDHLALAQTQTSSQMVFELLSERKPTKKELELFDLILNLSIDHGPDTPSAIETIKAAREGKTISESLAAGVLQINDRHGGAIEPLMKIIYQIKDGKKTIAQVLEENNRMPGFGHRIYKNQDPRAQLILNKSEQLLGENPYAKIVGEIEIELEKKTGKKLVINIDGAIAAVLCGFGFDPKLGKAVFLVARTPGLIGQYLNNCA